MQSVTLSCHLYLQNACQMQSFLPTCTTTSLIQVPITSLLDECNSLRVELSPTLPLYSLSFTKLPEVIPYGLTHDKILKSLPQPARSSMLWHLATLSTKPFQPCSCTPALLPDLYCSSKVPMILHLQVIYIC